MAISSKFGTSAGNAIVSGTLDVKDPVMPVAPPDGLQAIGPRVTFHFTGLWDKNTDYVYYDVAKDSNDNSYIAIKPKVPAGTALTDSEYWFKFDAPNQQFYDLEQTVETYKASIDKNTNSITTLNSQMAATTESGLRTLINTDVTAIHEMIADNETLLKNEIQNREKADSNILKKIAINVLTLGVKNDGSEDISAIVNEATKTSVLYFPAGVYKVSHTLNIVNSIFGDTYPVLWNGSGSILQSDINNVDSDKAVINIVSSLNSCSIEKLQIKCASTEKAINCESTISAFNFNVFEVGIYNCDSVGIYASSTPTASRIANIHNCSIWAKYSDAANYNDRIGIQLQQGTPDSHIDNVVIMGFKQGIYSRNMVFISNTHVYCGIFSTATNQKTNSFKDSIAFNIYNNAIINNVYADTCWVGLLLNNNTNVLVQNLFIYDDGNHGILTETAGPVLTVNQNTHLSIDGCFFNNSKNFWNGLIARENINQIKKLHNITFVGEYDSFKPSNIYQSDFDSYYIACSSNQEVARIVLDSVTSSATFKLDISATTGYFGTLVGQITNGTIDTLKIFAYSTKALGLKYKLEGNILSITANIGTYKVNILSSNNCNVLNFDSIYDNLSTRTTRNVITDGTQITTVNLGA